MNSRVQTMLQLAHLGSGKDPKNIFIQVLQAKNSHDGQTTREVLRAIIEAQMPQSMFLEKIKLFENLKVNKMIIFLKF